MNDGVGIWVDFDTELWLYVPMALPEGYSSPKKWAWDQAVSIGEQKHLEHADVVKLCKYLEHLAESSNEFEHRFVLLNDLNLDVVNVTVMFEMGEEGSDISALLSNVEEDEYIVPFYSDNLGTGLKALRQQVKKRIFRDDHVVTQLLYAFLKDGLAITAHASHAERDFLVEHEKEIDDLIKSVIAVA